MPCELRISGKRWGNDNRDVQWVDLTIDGYDGVIAYYLQFGPAMMHKNAIAHGSDASYMTRQFQFSAGRGAVAELLEVTAATTYRDQYLRYVVQMVEPSFDFHLDLFVTAGMWGAHALGAGRRHWPTNLLQVVESFSENSFNSNVRIEIRGLDAISLTYLLTHA